MQQLKVSITTESPLVIKASHNESNLISTLNYIPGSQLRGTLASRFGAEKKEFADLFLSNQVRFNNLYPEGSKPIPLSAFSCKYYAGFRNKDNPEYDSQGLGLNHGVYDKLVEKIRLTKGSLEEEAAVKYCKKELGAEANDEVLGLGSDNSEVEECDSFLKGYSGFYKLEEVKGNLCYQTVSIAKSKIERTAIDDKTNSARQGSLYILETIDEGQQFVGTIDILNDNSEVISRLKKLISKSNTAYFGTGKSRGHGQVKLEVLDDEQYSNQSKLSQQQKFAKIQDAINVSEGQTFFSLTLNSDTIIYNDLLQGKKDLNVEDILNYSDYLTSEEQKEVAKFKMVKEQAGSKTKDSKIYFAWLTPIYGWNSLTRLPKAVEPALAKGSVFCYQTEEEINENLLLEAFEKIEANGLGERRNEGYGQVVINDRFHWHKIKGGK
ncbi:MAG: RAMP superfamily CRISPR-associated protein [Bacillota bacterium]